MILEIEKAGRYLPTPKSQIHITNQYIYGEICCWQPSIFKVLGTLHSTRDSLVVEERK